MSTYATKYSTYEWNQVDMEIAVPKCKQSFQIIYLCFFILTVKFPSRPYSTLEGLFISWAKGNGALPSEEVRFDLPLPKIGIRLKTVIWTTNPIIVLSNHPKHNDVFCKSKYCALDQQRLQYYRATKCPHRLRILCGGRFSLVCNFVLKLTRDIPLQKFFRFYVFSSEWRPA